MQHMHAQASERWTGDAVRVEFGCHGKTDGHMIEKINNKKCEAPVAQCSVNPASVLTSNLLPIL